MVSASHRDLAAAKKWQDFLGRLHSRLFGGCDHNLATRLSFEMVSHVIEEPLRSGHTEEESCKTDGREDGIGVSLGPWIGHAAL